MNKNDFQKNNLGVNKMNESDTEYLESEMGLFNRFEESRNGKIRLKRLKKVLKTNYFYSLPLELQRKISQRNE